MKPIAKSHSGHDVYFARKDYDDIMNKYDLTSFPTRWTTNRENLYNLEYENGNVKKKHDWKVSKANYQIIQTNKPDNTADMMTCDSFGYKHIWNKSDCYLNSCTNRNLKELLTFEIEKTPYIRFCTKNLEVEFDWFALIATKFKTYMPLTAQAQEENTAWTQYYTVRAQENINALKSTNQPKKISINLTNKTIPNYRTWGTQTVPYCEVNYDLQELVDFINGLDLSNNHHLQKIRQFVNEYT